MNKRAGSAAEKTSTAPVLVNVVIPPLESPLTYELPEALRGSIEIGYRVEVPLGRRRAFGYVVSTQSADERPADTNSDFKIKSVLEDGEHLRCFDPLQLEFFTWIADYYGDSLSNVIDVAIPPAVPPKFERFVKLSGTAAPKLTGKAQAEVLKILSEQKEPLDLATLSRRVKGCARVLKGLEEKGLVQILSEELVDHHVSSEAIPQWAKSAVDLNAEQQRALHDIDAATRDKEFKAFILHGVTGSGKTEVYIEAIRQALERGQGALIIVPEIALTPQLIDRFRARLGNNLAVLHSALHKRSRWDSWRALLEGRCQVAIGARSGIFAPVPNLGLIVVDEEHESSYKQAEGLRYNARDLALVRAKLQNCSVVLGSATPSLESYLNAVKNKYTLISLPARHSSGSGLEISVVDLNRVKPWEMASRNISPQLAAALKDTLDRKEQSFLLYNRRGFASYLQCESCQATMDCPNCSVTLTFHKNQNSLQCHYCSLSLVVPEFCPSCRGSDGKSSAPLVQRGAGTEKIFEELETLFPTARISRLDRDSVADNDAYRRILNSVRDGSTDILVGTQMIAKGHDLPGVTLVGIVDCDVGLHMPDFRAGERVFQLLTQASGRAGRGDKAGLVLLQTRVPNHPSIAKTCDKDFRGFAEIELENRKSLGYPPFSRILRIVISSPNQEFGSQYARHLRALLDSSVQQRELPLSVLGPTVAPIARIRALWRWHFLVKGTSPSHLNQVMRDVSTHAPKSTQVRLVFDMDPQDLM
ncbi:MAG: primosomal protein N' [Deltaproteobacteria bacterium]|nr:primosomal protein N' [Deltaproteobacteria bacterium]